MNWYDVENPFGLFDLWLSEAEATEYNDPLAMVLATVDARQRPSVRTVLVKKWGEKEGFMFFTNLSSRKAKAIADTPYVAGLFYWKKTYRQVRIEGPVFNVSEDESEAYFARRPRESQLAAWASQQSQPLEDLSLFENNLKNYREKFEGQDVPKPPLWGGYSIQPERMEFWLGHPYRQHERLLFEQKVPPGNSEKVTWSKSFLYP